MLALGALTSLTQLSVTLEPGKALTQSFQSVSGFKSWREHGAHGVAFAAVMNQLAPTAQPLD